MANETGLEPLLALLQEQQAAPVTHTNGGTTNTWQSPLVQAKNAADTATKLQKMQNDAALVKAKLDKDQEALANTISGANSKAISDASELPIQSDTPVSSTQKETLPISETQLTAAAKQNTPEIGSAMLPGVAEHLSEDENTTALEKQDPANYAGQAAYRNDFLNTHGIDQQGNPYEMVGNNKITYAPDEPRGQFIIDSLKDMEKEQQETADILSKYSYDPSTGAVYQNMQGAGQKPQLLTGNVANSAKDALAYANAIQGTNDPKLATKTPNNSDPLTMLASEKQARRSSADLMKTFDAFGINSVPKDSDNGALKQNDPANSIPEEWRDIYESAVAKNIPKVPEMEAFRTSLAGMISRNSGATQAELDKMANSVTAVVENMDQAFNKKAYLVGSIDDFDYTRKNAKTSPAKVAADICAQMGYPASMQQFIADEIGELKNKTGCSNNALVGMVVRNNIKSAANNGVLTREDKIAPGYSWKRDWWGISDNQQAIDQLNDLMDPKNKNNYKQLSERFLRINNIITDMQEINPAYQRAQQALTKQASINAKWGNSLSDHYHKKWSASADKASLDASKALMTTIYKNIIPAINEAAGLYED